MAQRAYFARDLTTTLSDRPGTQKNDRLGAERKRLKQESVQIRHRLARKDEAGCPERLFLKSLSPEGEGLEKQKQGRTRRVLPCTSRRRIVTDPQSGNLAAG
jgi:hypothetical protein